MVLAARDAGWRAVSLLCFLAPAERERRRDEAERAARQLGIELRFAGEPLLSASARSDPDRTREQNVNPKIRGP